LIINPIYEIIRNLINSTHTASIPLSAQSVWNLMIFWLMKFKNFELGFVIFKEEKNSL